jgi:hypothetical protein
VSAAGIARLQHAGQFAHLFHADRNTVLLERALAVSDRCQIGDEIRGVAGRKTEIEQPVKMPHNLRIVVKSAVVEVGCVEIGVKQRRGLHEAAGADVMPQMIGESAGRDVTSGTAEMRLVRERLEKQRLAAAFGVTRLGSKAAAGLDLRIWKKIDVVDVGHQGVEDGGTRLRAGKLVDNDTMDEVAQRGDTAIMAVRRQKARAAQTWDPDRVENAVECLWVEDQARGVEIARARRRPRNEQFWIGGAVDMASAAAHFGLPRLAAQNGRRVEGEIAEIAQVRFAAANGFRME